MAFQIDRASEILVDAVGYPRKQKLLSSRPKPIPQTYQPKPQKSPHWDYRHSTRRCVHLHVCPNKSESKIQLQAIQSDASQRVTQATVATPLGTLTEKVQEVTKCGLGDNAKFRI